MNTRERERGQTEAMGRRDTHVAISYEDLAKLRTLLDTFLDVNADDNIRLAFDTKRNVTVTRHQLINNITDIAYVLGYLEGLST